MSEFLRLMSEFRGSMSEFSTLMSESGSSMSEFNLRNIQKKEGKFHLLHSWVYLVLASLYRRCRETFYHLL